MRPYGLNRSDVCNNNIRGTSRPCPCCIPQRQHNDKQRKAGNDRKTRSRRAAKAEILNQIEN